MIRALLVDDESTFVRTMHRSLGKRGQPRIRLDDCRTSRAALARLQNRLYDAVVLDWMLGDEDGLELGSRIRELPNGRLVALIMVTGRCTANQSEQLALRAGFDDFMRKPFDPEILRLRLAAAVGRAAVSRGPVGRVPPPGEDCGLADHAIEVSFDEPAAAIRSRWVRLRNLEWKLARALYVRRGQVVDRPTLVREIWGSTPPADPRDAVDHVLAALRTKLGPSRWLLETVRGLLGWPHADLEQLQRRLSNTRSLWLHRHTAAGPLELDWRVLVRGRLGNWHYQLLQL